MLKSTVTSKGQVTIPIDIRRHAHIESGTSLEFHLEKNGSITLKPLTKDFRSLKGIVKSKRKKPVSLKEMKNAIHASIMDKIQ